MKIVRKRRLSVFIVLVVVLTAVAGGAYAMISFSAQPKKQPATQASRVVDAPKPTKVESKMLVMGDVFWGRYINDWSMKSEQKYAYPFQRLDEFKRSEYDAWIADIECPITDNPKMSSATEDTTLKFDCSPEYLTYAKQYFTAFTLANNHTDNQNGVDGWRETINHLASNNIQSFGSFDPEDYENLCNILSLPARITMDDESITTVQLPTVWCGFHGVFKNPSSSSIEVMNKYTKRFNVFAMPHSGQEYKTGPDQIKTEFYRRLVDGGAEVVIGNHPHWIQNTESYKGHLIMYSLGNFIFDQQDTIEVTRGAVLQIALSLDARDAPDLEQWIELGKDCSAYNDSCMQQADEQGLQKLPFKYHFSVLGSNDSGKIVKPATAEQLSIIKERLSWSETIANLNGVYSGE